MWWHGRALWEPRTLGLRIYVLRGVLLWTKSCAVAWLDHRLPRWEGRAGLRGLLTFLLPSLNLAAAFQGRALPSSTHIDSAQQP